MTSVLLEDVSYSGEGGGAGIFLNACDVVRIVRPYVHDVVWEAMGHPQRERFSGIWLLGTPSCVVSDVQVTRLWGRYDDQYVKKELGRAYQTDGIRVGGCRNLQIIGGTVNYVGQGINLSSSEPNLHFAIANVNAIDCDAFGFKFAHTAAFGSVSGCVARDCGLAGFTIEARSHPSMEESFATGNLLFTGCTAYETAPARLYEANWKDPKTMARKRAGFALTAEDRLVREFPNEVRFVGCQAVNQESTWSRYHLEGIGMDYGFFAAPPPPGARALVLPVATACQVRGARFRPQSDHVVWRP